MLKKFFVAIFLSVLIISNFNYNFSTANATKKDVWVYQTNVTGSRLGRKIDFYVLTDTIKGNGEKLTVNVKLVGDNSTNNVATETLEFRIHEGLWCAYPSENVYVPVSTHINARIVNIFNVCIQYRDFIKLSELDVKAKTAKKFFDEGSNYYFKENNFDSAINCFTRAIALYPEYAEAYINRARSYSKKGNYDAAIADYKKVLAMNKDPYNIAKNELEQVIQAKQNISR